MSDRIDDDFARYLRAEAERIVDAGMAFRRRCREAAERGELLSLAVLPSPNHEVPSFSKGGDRCH